MPATTLDPKTALVVIDLQKGFRSFPTVHPFGEVMAKACELLDAFRRKRLPVVLVNVAGGPAGRTEQSRAPRDLPPDWVELADELNPQSSDLLVTKRTRSAFANTELEARLKALGVTQIVLVGVSTSAGVESSGRHAFDLGFNVTFATDAMTDMSAEAHANSISLVFPKVGETATTREIIALLEGAGA
jgi:nicotinamidase-related amidase